MPEAVIVDAIRTPIGRAGKGSLTGVRADDLAGVPLKALVERNPGVDFSETVDVMMGCGFGMGEAGYNVGRNATLLAGLDHHIPGTTVNRFCASSLQAIRMAFHGIKAGEGDVFVAAGVEAVSRYVKGNADSHPDSDNPLFDAAKARTEGHRTWVDPRATGELPNVYLSMGQTAENVAEVEGVSRAEQDAFAVRSQNRAEKALADGFWEREITPVRLPDGTVVSRDDSPRAGVTLDAVASLTPAFHPNGTVTAGNACPLND